MTLHTYMVDVKDVEADTIPDRSDLYPFGCHWIKNTKTVHLTATISSQDLIPPGCTRPDWFAEMFGVPVENIHLRILKRD